MECRNYKAIERIDELKNELFSDVELSKELLSRNASIFNILSQSTLDDFKNGVTFKFTKLSSTPKLQKLSNIIKEIKDNIKIIQTRDYLSITPKLEDIALVNRWIQNFNVPHYYLQVFFDKAYIISFENILDISSNPSNEGIKFSIEKDTKNQGKTTIKIDVNQSNLIIDKIEMPKHHSQMKELDRGRLLFYVHFDDSDGNLNNLVFERIFK